MGLAGALLALSACTGDATPTDGGGSLATTAASGDGASSAPAPGSSDSAVEEAIGPIASAEPTQTEAPGSIGSRDLPTADVGAPVAIEPGVKFQVERLRDVRIEAEGPGEVAGPGVIARIRVTNDSASSVDLDGVAVNLDFGEDPGVPSFGPQTRPFEGALAPGRSASAEYAFLKLDGAGSDIVMRIEYNNSENVVVVRS